VPARSDCHRDRPLPDWAPAIGPEHDGVSAMKLRRVAVFTLMSMLCAAQAGAADPECLSRLSDSAKRARAHINLYLGAMKAMNDNPWARNSASVCGSAFSRAEQYYKKQGTDNALCTGSSSYVDNQIAQLYKTASSTCRSEFNSVLSKLPAEEQRELSASIAKGEAGLR
jgi:hypothetical protein